MLPKVSSIRKPLNGKAFRAARQNSLQPAVIGCRQFRGGVYVLTGFSSRACPSLSTTSNWICMLANCEGRGKLRLQGQALRVLAILAGRHSYGRSAFLSECAAERPGRRDGRTAL